jgi:hypothetical protein
VWGDIEKIVFYNLNITEKNNKTKMIFPAHLEVISRLSFVPLRNERRKYEVTVNPYGQQENPI